MKRRTTPVLKIQFDLSSIPSSYGTVSQIDFIFKQRKAESAHALVEKSYKSSGTTEVELNEGIYVIPFTMAETALFEADQNFYMDTRIKISDSSGNSYYPDTDIITLRMTGTLFETNEMFVDD